MKTMKTILMLATVLILTSCAKWSNKVDANGGVFGSYDGDWIVLTYSGNHITDVWKMTDVMVQSEEGSDGWLFVDNNKNVIHVGGNTKAIRVNDRNAAEWDNYVEYHSEFTNMTYQQYCLDKQQDKSKVEYSKIDTSQVCKESLESLQTSTPNSTK
jgi:hypothetical protein